MIKSKKCKIEGCNNPSWSKGLCQKHTQKSPLKKNRSSNTSVTLVKNEELAERSKMMDFMDDLWNKQEQPRKCQSCGKKITGDNLSIYWHHILPKSRYSQFKFESKNMMFVCADCHTEIENGFPSDIAKEYISKAKKGLLK